MTDTTTIYNREAFDAWDTEGDSDNKFAFYKLTREKQLKQCWNAATAAERERCAVLCEKQAKEPECPERAQHCADAIRSGT